MGSVSLTLLSARLRKQPKQVTAMTSEIWCSAIDGTNGEVTYDNAIHAYWREDEIISWEVRPGYPEDLRPC
jgi:hypothetical protein